MKKKIFWWIALATVFVFAALWVPQTYIEKFSNLFGAKQAPSPFDDGVAHTDRALDQDFDLYVDLATLDEMVPRLQVRRLAAHGPIAADEIPRVVETLQQFTVDPRARNMALSDILKRWEPLQIEAALSPLDTQLAHVRPRYSKTPEDCMNCHLQTVAAPAAAIDVAGLWPLVSPESLDFGKRIPILSDSMEQDALRYYAHPDRIGKGPFSTEESQHLLTASCLSCHSPHGDVGFEVDTAMRMANIGLWLSAYNADDILHVQAKVQNLSAAHRVPGGWANHAYVLLIEVWDSSEKSLHSFHGSLLPDFLQDEGKGKAGALYARWLLDAHKKPTSDLSNIHDIQSDSRLEPRRFEELSFLYPLKQGASSRVRARIIYLPDFTTWDGAVDVEVRTMIVNESP